MTELYAKLSASHPALERGQVWCRSCGATRRIQSAFALRMGWLEGRWFGDPAPEGPYWWRKYLPLLNSQSASPAVEGVSKLERDMAFAAGIEKAAQVADMHDLRGDIGTAIRALIPSPPASLGGSGE